jgi:hypothetical protein
MDGDALSDDSVDPTAVVGRRIAGWMVDVAIVVVAVTLALVALGDSFQRPGPSTSLDVRFIDGDTAIFFRSTVAVVHAWEWAVAGGAAVLVVLIGMIILPGRRGWSPGLLAADLRLVGPDGHRVGVRRALVRFIGWIVDALPGVPLVGYIAMRTGRHHQRVGDRMARTFVVDHRLAGQPPTELVAVESTQPTPIPVPDDVEDGPEVETSIAEVGPGSGAQEPPSDESPDAGDDADWGPAGPPGPPAGVEADQPLWDRQHERYVMWHGKTGKWVTYDDSEESWRPL